MILFECLLGTMEIILLIFPKILKKNKVEDIHSAFSLYTLNQVIISKIHLPIFFLYRYWIFIKKINKIVEKKVRSPVSLKLINQGFTFIYRTLYSIL